MSTELKARPIQRVEPFGRMCLIKKDDDLAKSRGGIILPDEAKIHVVTGHLVGISKALKDQRELFDFEELDKVYFNTAYAFPVDFSPGNKYFFVDFAYIYGKIVTVDPDEDE